MDVVDLSRLQFAITALYHFLFVPLTLGLSFILAIMESVYVMTGKQIYKDMTRFWGKLFGINFAMGIATGITMEFQFGTNWAYYAHYVGDIFGTPLAIEGLMAFFLESTFVGLFFFGWNKLSRVQHLVVTWLVAIGSNLSALWILIANGWMQNPTGAEFNYQTMRMELTSFAELFFNPVAQVKFVHTIASGYVTGAVFVLSISAYYIMRKRDVAFAYRSFAVAAGFGLASVLSVIVLGDESGYETGAVQKMKLAAIEGEWETHEPPAPFTVVGMPNMETRSTDYAVRIPYVLGLIATRSIDQPVQGINDLVNEAEVRVRVGIEAYRLLEKIKSGDGNDIDIKLFDVIKTDLGYGLLLKRFTPNVVDATEAQIRLAALSTVPNVPVLFWVFRLMVACGFLMLFLFVISFYYSIKHRYIPMPRWLLRLAFFSLPLPWIASQSGWIVAEYGRQPWAIAEVLPTALGVSSVSAGHVWGSLIGFVVLYTFLAVLDVYLIVKYVRMGPSSLHSGRYHFEQKDTESNRNTIEQDT